MLFGLVGLELHLFLDLRMEQLMSGGHLQTRLIYELESLLGELIGCLLLGAEVLRVSILLWGLCMNRS